MQATFEKLLSKYLDDSGALVVAYSGGLDSTCLLFLAHHYALKSGTALSAVHVNHQLSPNAHQWQSHCEDVCARLNIPIQVKVVSVKAKGNSLEAVARKLRYEAIADAFDASKLILLGQHKDDQAETLMLQLMRGAGPQGLSAMAEYSINQHGSRLLRPLLAHSKQSLEAFASESGLRWVEDESNKDSRYDRNFLRNEIMPLLSDRWPSAIEALARSVRHIQTHEQLLQEQVQEKYASMQVSDSRLSIPLLKQQSTNWQALIIKHWVKDRGHSQPSEKILQRILIDCLRCKPGSQPVVSWDGWQCCRSNDELYLFPSLEAHQTDAINVTSEITSLSGGLGEIYFSRRKPETDELTAAPLLLPLDVKASVEFGGFSRRFKPENAQHSKPLKQWFQLWNIPVWERKRIPLLIINEQVYAVGNRISHALINSTLVDASTYYYRWRH